MFELPTTADRGRERGRERERERERERLCAHCDHRTAETELHFLNRCKPFHLFTFFKLISFNRC